MKAQATDRLAEICQSAAEAAADGDGFIAVHRLVALLDAELQARPLLFEGMLAAPKTEGGKWIVAIDSSRSGFCAKTYATESVASSLPPRLRFTIAHELGHLLQMRSSEAEVSNETVSDFERQADTLSPLLLVSSAELNRRLVADRARVTLQDLLNAKKAWVISSDVLVTRLRLLHRFDPIGLRFRDGLNDVAIGIGERMKNGVVRLVDWPSPFFNFHDKLVPEFLLPQKKDARPSLTQIFDASDFVLNGGDEVEAIANAFGGTLTNPRCEQMRIKLTVEKIKSGRFLFLAERI